MTVFQTGKSSEQSSGGCLKYGCIIALVIAVTVGSALYFYVRSAIRSAVVTYLDAERLPIEPSLTDASARSVARSEGAVELAKLKTALSGPLAPGDVREFRFTPPQVEELIREALAALLPPDGFGLSIDPASHEIMVRFSISTRALRNHWNYFDSFLSPEEDRFFNGSAAMRLSVTNRVPSVNVTQLVVRREVFPEMGRTAAASWLKQLLTSLLDGSLSRDSGQSDTTPQSASPNGAVLQSDRIQAGQLQWDRIRDSQVRDGAFVITVTPVITPVK